MPAISVGLPVYNGQQFVAEAIESILAQSEQDLELVISDNASTDATGEICERYARLDPRVRYHRQATNLGAAVNFSRVFELSTGEYFRWAGVDDKCGPDLLRRCKAVLDADPAIAVCVSKVKIIDGDGNVIEDYADRQALLGATPSERFMELQDQDSWCNSIYGLIRSRVLKQTRLMGSFPGSDIALMAEIALHGKFHEIPDYQFFRRIHGEAYSYEYSAERARAFYDPQRRSRRLQMYHWRLLWEYLRAILRAPVGATERRRLLVRLGRIARWRRKDLLEELRNLRERSRTQTA